MRPLNPAAAMGTLMLLAAIPVTGCDRGPAAAGAAAGGTAVLSPADEIRARTCCDCCNGIWSSDEDCALASAQLPAYRLCAGGTAWVDATRVAEDIVRDPVRYFRRESGELQRIIETCEQLAGEAPDDPFVALNLGLFQYYQRDLDGAVASLSAAVEDERLLSDPVRTQEAFEHLGLAYQERGDLAMAEEAFARNVEAWERMPIESAYYRGCPFQRLGELYDQTDRVQLAETFHRRAASIELHDPIRHLEGALGYLVTGQHADAVAALDVLDELLLARRDEQPQTRVILVELRARSRTTRGFAALFDERSTRAGDLFTEALTLQPGEVGAGIGQGYLQLERGELSAAEGSFQLGLEEAGMAEGPAADAGGYELMLREMSSLGLARLEMARGRPVEALAHYDRILAGDGSAIHALVGKASALVSLERGDEAWELIERVLKIDPDNAYARGEAGIVAYNRGDLEHAEEHFRAAAERAGATATCPHEGLGLVYLSQGRMEDARASFETAIEIDPDVDFRKYNGLARIHIEAGDYDRAEALLLKSRSNHPQDSEASELLAEIERLRRGRSAPSSPGTTLP